MDLPASPTGPGDASASGASATHQSSASWSQIGGRWARRILAGLVSLIATYLGGCLLALLVYSMVFPPITGVQLQRQVEAAFSDAHTEQTYEPVPLARLDRDLPLAVVAGEDSRFFLHWGIDWKEVGKALRTYWQGGELRGASSITQQLVKNLFMTTHSTLLRKALEVPLTYGAELLLSKRRILELYVNVIEWGPGVFGAEAATHYHYGTSAEHLSRYRAAALAACIPNPLHRHPHTVDGYTSVILERMAIIGELPISAAAPPPESSASPAPFVFPTARKLP